MIGAIINLIFLCILAGFIWWAAQLLMTKIAIAEPFITFIRILVAALILVLVLYALSILLGMAGINVPTWGSLVK